MKVKEVGRGVIVETKDLIAVIREDDKTIVTLDIKVKGQDSKAWFKVGNCDVFVFADGRTLSVGDYEAELLQYY